MPERWLDAGVGALRPEAFQVQSTREEFALLFGSPAESGAKLERRILIPPILAKRLARVLADLARDPNATPAGTTASAAAERDVPAAARPMLRKVRALGVGFGFEKSFKMSPGRVSGDRVILGVPSALVAPAAFVKLCRELGMPKTHLSQFQARLPEANTVGFGFEGSARGGGSFKVYLEFWDRVRQRVQQDPRNVAPVPLFVGYKWPAGSGKTSVAEYTCHPLLSIEAISSRLQALYERDSPSGAAAREIMALAAARIRSDDSFVYVEAAEKGNPRRSFDVNFYKAGLRVADVRPALSRLRARYAIDAGKFESLLDECAARPFGHLSGGLGRDGEDFLTVYYEIEGL